MIFLAGSTGFIGRHVAEILKGRGEEVRCLVRPDSDKDAQQRAKERARLSNAGYQTVSGNVCDHDHLEVLLEGCVAVVNLVGSTVQTRKQRYQQSHVEATQRLVDAAAAAGVKHFVQMSSLGAHPDSASAYHRSKFESEEIVRAGRVPWTILRASVVTGSGDVFTNMIIDLLEKPLVAPVPCDGETLLQPVAVTDVARCVAQMTAQPAPHAGRVVEVGGPSAMRFSEMVDVVGDIYGRHNRAIRIPPGVVRPWAYLRQAMRAKKGITVDQLRILEVDSTCDYASVRGEFDWEFTSFEAAARDAIASRVAALATVVAT